jgi:hypothetical protein
MDELLIPVFVLISLVGSLLALALLLYAFPVRASVRLVLKDGPPEQTLVISWSIFAIRTSHTCAGVATEVLVANHTVLSHAGPVKSDEKGHTLDQPAVPVGTLDAAEIVHSVQALVGPVGSFGSAFWRECRFEEARGRVTLGLGDPVLTGECCGLYWASRFILEASRIYLELEPVFDRQILELDITARMKVRHPLLILIAGLQLARHPAIHDAMKALKRQPGGVPAL